MRPTPTNLHVNRAARQVEVRWSDGTTTAYGFVALREACPCAGCRGHSPGEVPPPVAPPEIDLVRVEPVGQYAVGMQWSDGHTTGIYSFDFLRQLADEA